MSDVRSGRIGWKRLAGPVGLAAAIVWCSSRAIWFPPAPADSDKVVHLLVFGLLATLVARLPEVRRTRVVGVYAAVIIVSVFGATDELHQHFTPGRTMDFYDWVADTTGAALATLLYANWRWYRALLETPVRTLFAKRRVEIAADACVIGEDGISGSEKADC